MPLLSLERRRGESGGPLDRATAGLVAVRQQPTGQRALHPDEQLAALGLRSLADLLAPSSLVISDNYLVLDGQYTRVLAITDLPPVVATGWLDGVLAEKLPVDVSLHMRPLDRAGAASALKLKSWRLGGALSDDAANGRPVDNNLTAALEQIERLRRGLARRETALFLVGLYLQLRASSAGQLDALTQRVAGLFGAQTATALVPRLQQEQGFRACLPEARDT